MIPISPRRPPEEHYEIRLEDSAGRWRSYAATQLVIDRDSAPRFAASLLAAGVVVVPSSEAERLRAWASGLPDYLYPVPFEGHVVSKPALTVCPVHPRV